MHSLHIKMSVMSSSSHLWFPLFPKEMSASKEDYVLPWIFLDYVCLNPALWLSLLYTWRRQLEHFRYRCEPPRS